LWACLLRQRWAHIAAVVVVIIAVLIHCIESIVIQTERVVTVADVVAVTAACVHIHKVVDSIIVIDGGSSNVEIIGYETSGMVVAGIGIVIVFQFESSKSLSAMISRIEVVGGAVANVIILVVGVVVAMRIGLLLLLLLLLLHEIGTIRLLLVIEHGSFRCRSTQQGTSAVTFPSAIHHHATADTAVTAQSTTSRWPRKGIGKCQERLQIFLRILLGECMTYQ